jgi:hypothetical protein
MPGGPPSFIAQLLFVVAFVIGFVAYRKLSVLMRMEYDRHRDNWLVDGGPISSLWRPPESDFVTGRIAESIVMVRWLFRTPSWTRNDPEACRYLSGYRIYTAVFVVLLITVMVIWGKWF